MSVVTSGQILPSGWLKGAVYVLGFVIPLITGGVAYLHSIERDAINERYNMVSTRLDTVAGTQAGLIVGAARNTEHARLQEQQQQHWEGRVEYNSRRISELATKASARHDPFTGTQGRALERRIDKLEGCCARSKWEVGM